MDVAERLRSVKGRIGFKRFIFSVVQFETLFTRTEV